MSQVEFLSFVTIRVFEFPSQKKCAPCDPSSSITYDRRQFKASEMARYCHRGPIYEYTITVIGMKPAKIFVLKIYLQNLNFVMKQLFITFINIHLNMYQYTTQYSTYRDKLRSYSERS